MNPDPEPRRERRFGLGDSLILLAAVALTLGALREMHWFDRFPSRFAYWWNGSLSLLGLRSWGLPGLTRRQLTWLVAGQVVDEILVQLLATVLLSLTLAQPFLRLRHPRPPRRQFLRQSGLVVCLGMILGALIAVDARWVAGVDPGYGFGSAWAALLLWPLLGVFPWRSEASWIDRLGRATGWGWIIVLLAAPAAAYLLS